MLILTPKTRDSFTLKSKETGTTITLTPNRQKTYMLVEKDGGKDNVNRPRRKYADGFDAEPLA